MDLENLRKTWNRFGQSDPLWSILAWEGKAGNNWDSRDFFEVGKGEIAYILTEAEKRKQLIRKNKSLDFGCGVGRLTFPLAEYFQESHGVDISQAMIDIAEKFKTEKGKKNCQFHLNTRENLKLFPDSNFDFILSIIVLQHMEPRYFFAYISEFIRILKIGGVLVFQLPDETENRANYESFSTGTIPVMEMYGKSKEELINFIEARKGKVLDVVEDQSCGIELKSYRYFVTK